MVVRIASLSDIASRYSAIVLDQWGVLHDGSKPYPDAQEGLARLRQAGVRLAVLSNSGKRAGANAARIQKMGFDATLFAPVMTSGEALWQDICDGVVPEQVFCPIEGAAGDAADWAVGLDIALTSDMSRAQAVLLMGLPDDGSVLAQQILDDAMARGLTIYCTNPDRASPRADGVVVVSPGALAHECVDAGARVRFYGKPHLPVFRAVEAALQLPPERLLMVGDSLDHDIAGAAAAGWSSAFVQGGLYAAEFAASADPIATLVALCRQKGAPLPDFTLATLR